MRALVLVLIGLLAASPAFAQTKPKLRDSGVANPASAIYIGNSFFYYNNSLHGHVGRLVAEGVPGHRFRTSSVTISGSGFDWHDVESYFRPKGIGSYSFDRENRIVFNPPGQKLFDLAIMMDCSQCPLHPTLKATFAEYAKKHSDTVRRHGARPVFFMSWAYADAPEMTAQLAEAYTQAGNAHDALVIPAGLAFARSIAERPGLDLYVADKRHPSLAGTYLAAATVYAALFGKSPVGLAYDAGLGADTARHLQNVAWATVQDYYKP
ncbi:MAG: hypothetical protein FJX46_13890 [Alphaproteobacteria bacterium]|nr:hypothetical protein [Alphaproteobacteria bacterium]